MPRADDDARYQRTEKGRARQARYERSAKGRARRARYDGSAKGLLRTMRQLTGRRGGSGDDAED